MVAKRQRDDGQDEPMSALPEALRNVEVTDEDPALFWGTDWQEKLDEALKSVEAGDGELFYSAEEFFAALEADMHE